MSELRGQLARWRTAGLIDAETSAKIAQFEAGREAAAERAAEERPGLLEAVAYLGVAVVGVGVFVLLANAWDGIAEAVRPFIPAVAAVLAIVAGVFMRQSSEGGIRRGGTSAWAGSVALAATAAGLWTDQLGSEDAIPLVAGITAMSLAIILWFAWHSTMQVLALALGGMVLMAGFAQGADAWTDLSPTAVGGFVMLAMGIIAVTSAETGILVPTLPARGIAGLAVGFGASMASMQIGAFEVLPLIAGAGLIWLSIRTGYFGYTFVGVAVIFFGLFTSVVKHVRNPTIAALLLILIGLALLASVVLISRRRPWQAAVP